MKSIQKILRDHSEAALISLAVIFLAVIGGFLYETIGVTVAELSGAIVTPPSPTSEGFDLAGAASINLRGLPVDGSPASVQLPVVQPVPVKVVSPPVPAIITTSTPVATSTTGISTSTVVSSSVTAASGTIVQ